ncbi:Flp pilus assembly protein CpaB [Halobacillus seohaensis]|uniref:Flp pilus assembly protein CpaB n=1 Tax=Halobacillus seohaensis TaxID=447421 RepID=A0ABW2ETX2_9BACI
MRTKKLWIWSILFGLCATAVLYLYLESYNTPEQAVNASEDSGQVKEKEPKEEESEEFSNEMIPIEEGKRAMSVQLSDPQGVGGFIKPGDYIDVVANLTVPEDSEDDQHDAGSLVLQNVKVLAIGHAADAEEESKRYQMVTVEVSPKEGLTLGFTTKYDLYMMLRAEGDDKKEKENLHIHEDQLHKGVFLK